MEDLVSVCVAAWNEEATIGNTLDSTLKQNFPGKMEVLVCANGCTDRTPEIVRDYEKRDLRVRLIETAQRGKPHAWNILMAEAQSNYVVFEDADVVIGEGSIRYLFEGLDKGKIAVAGRCVPYTKGSSFLAKRLSTPNTKARLAYYLCGVLYAVNRDKLVQRMSSMGFEAMPDDIITEDVWVHMVVGEENQALVEEAAAFHRPYTLKELIGTGVRNSLGVKQLEQRYGYCHKTYRDDVSLGSETFYERQIRRIKKLIETEGLKEKANLIINFTIARTIVPFITSQISARLAQIENPNITYWYTAQNTKRPIRLAYR